MSVVFSGLNLDTQIGVVGFVGFGVGCHMIVRQLCVARCKSRVVLCVYTCLHVQQGLSCLVQFCQTSVYLQCCKVFGAAAKLTHALPVCIAAQHRM